MERPAFACDAMLGSLARWLRFAGFDTLYAPHVDDWQLAARAHAEGRWLLTRDRVLAARTGPRVVCLTAATLEGQVAELRRRLGLEVRQEEFCTRCSHCNGLLRPASQEEVRGLVPPFVATHASHFARCTLCGRVYWPGTHFPRILRRLEQLFLAD
ncbi:MAG: Mut7-C RNAse domain-containing protein [Thermoanaerobaculum sp.]|nr:Mut7-C RNAse domain-containing protein [Thermoanaerobaculum sp.]MDW7967073.1 Mut7-C RNAse domain-containing protein [Thermoanaerobaculum sp.]